MGVLAAVGLSVGGAYLQGENARNNARYNQRIANANADLLMAQEGRINQKAEQEAGKIRANARRVVGAQQATAAASNIAIDTGNIAALGEEAQLTALEDVRTLRNNAFLEAYGIRTQALNYRAEGEAAVQAADTAAKFGLITAGLQGFAAGGGFSKMGGSSKAPTTAPNASPTADSSTAGSYFAGLSSTPKTATVASNNYLGSDRYVW